MKDTITLKDNADFRTRVYKGVNWVPVNTLGKSRYTNEEIKLIAKLKPEEIIKKIHNLYEAIQLMQIGDFQITADNDFIDENGLTWEHHKTGMDALKNNAGCCSSLASWIYTLLEGEYDDLKLFMIIALKGSCHVINYIEYNGKKYLVDGYGMANKYNENIPVETGLLTDFVSKKIFTAVLVEISDIQVYIDFYKRYFIKKKDCFDFFFIDQSYVPPVYFHRNENMVTLTLKKNANVNLISRDKNHILNFNQI